MTDRLSYLRRMVTDRILQRNLSCPNCGSPSSTLVDRKYVVTELRRCTSCRLMFRSPTDTPEFNNEFYNAEYEQGFTTELPNDDELQRLKESRFVGSPKDYSLYWSILRQIKLRPNARLFDFGCSWGYGAWQMQQAGFEVWATEVSIPRRRYASKRLGVRVIEDVGQFVTDPGIDGSFDCFFSAHVLEHVPAPSEVFALAARLLKPGGLFISFTPNGCAQHRAVSVAWSKLWGSVHPNFIDDEFLDRSFSEAPRLITSTSSESEWLTKLIFPPTGSARFDLERGELLFAARLPTDRKWNSTTASA